MKTRHQCDGSSTRSSSSTGGGMFDRRNLSGGDGSGRSDRFRRNRL